MTPSLLVMASYVRDDNEVVADYVTINAAVKLANQVSRAWFFFRYATADQRLPPE